MAAVAPTAAFFVARSLTHTADRPLPRMENVEMSVTWSTAWRGTPAQVSVTRYQPTASRFGSWIQATPSSMPWILTLALTTRVRPAVGTGVVVETCVQLGAFSMAFHASIAASMPDSRWTVTGIVVGALAPSGTSIQTPIAAFSRGFASRKDLCRLTVTLERAAPAVSNRTRTSCWRTWPVPLSGSPWVTVMV